jgi:hypothetical protein
MTTRNIDEQIRSYYLQQTLSPESLNRLRTLIDKPRKTRVSESGMWRTLAIAAAIALAFLAGALFVTRHPASSVRPVQIANDPTVDISNTLAHEVAMRHENCKHTDFTETELKALAAQMTKLDFALALPDGIDMSKLKLQGGHYCVVNGQLALHANFIDQKGDMISLIETRSSPQFASLRHAMQQIDELEVEMWQKDGVVLAMARPV